MITSSATSGAAKPISSKTRSKTVCSRRAPMFSVALVDVHREGRAADRWRSSGRKSSVTPSAASSALYCSTSAFLRLGEDGLEVFGGQRIQLDANRKAALQFGNQVGRLAHVKRAGRDEQHVVGLERSVLGGDRASLRRSAECRAARPRATRRDRRAPRASGDLVDLVDEDDPVLAGAAQRLALDRVHVDELGGFFLLEDAPRVGDGHALLRLSSWAECRRASRRCRRRPCRRCRRRSRRSAGCGVSSTSISIRRTS